MNPVLVCAVTMKIETIWKTNLASSSGLVASGGAIYIAAMSILSVMLLYGIYEAFMKGGGTRDVVLVMVKVAVCAFLIQNWTSFFNDISTNGSFVLANAVHNGTSYTSLYSKYVATNLLSEFKHFSLIDLGKDAIETIEIIFYALANAIYWVGYYFLIGCFTIFGLVLFVVGPLIVALYPSSLFGSFAKSYLKGLLQWLAWPIIYAIIGILMTQLFATTYTVNTKAGVGSSPTNSNYFTNLALLALLGIALFFVPWIANHIIGASFTGAAAVVGGAAKSLAAAGAAVATGGIGGIAGGMGMMGTGSGAAGAAGGAGSGGGGAAAAVASGGSGPGGGGGGSKVAPPSPTLPPSQSGGGSQPSSSGSGGSGAAVNAPSVSPAGGGTPIPAGGGGSSDSDSSAGGDGSTATPGASPSPSTGSGGREKRWNWSNAAAGAVIGYQQGFDGMANIAARNHLRGNTETPLAPPKK